MASFDLDQFRTSYKIIGGDIIMTMVHKSSGVLEPRPFLSFCKDLYDNQQQTDLVFITKDAEIQCHKLIFVLSSVGDL